MTIKEELSAELKEAMLTKDGPRRDVVRQVETEVSLIKSEPGFQGGQDEDELYRRVIATYVKKMEKSRDEYAGYGERGAAIASKLGYEVEFLSRWLPTKLDEDATRELAAKAISELGVDGDQKAAGRVIGQLMNDHGADLDGGLVNRLVREILAGE